MCSPGVDGGADSCCTKARHRYVAVAFTSLSILITLSPRYGRSPAKLSWTSREYPGLRRNLSIELISQVASTCMKVSSYQVSKTISLRIRECLCVVAEVPYIPLNGLFELCNVGPATELCSNACRRPCNGSQNHMASSKFLRHGFRDQRPFLRFDCFRFPASQLTEASAIRKRSQGSSLWNDAPASTHAAYTIRSLLLDGPRLPAISLVAWSKAEKPPSQVRRSQGLVLGLHQ